MRYCSTSIEKIQFPAIATYSKVPVNSFHYRNQS